MARAKHTDRTEARRRHRAEQAALAAAEASGEPLDDRPTAMTAAAKAATATPPGRPSLTGSFRGAFRPLDLRGDLRALPQVMSHWAVLLSIGIALGSAFVFIASTNELGASLDFTLSEPFAGKSLNAASNLSLVIVTLFVVPPPAAGAFLIGFTAPRASWLGGLIYALIAAIGYAIILMSPAGRMFTSGAAVDLYLVNVMATAAVGGLLFASLAAWYRRFLNLVNPNRGRKPAPARGKERPRQATAKAGSRSR